MRTRLRVATEPAYHALPFVATDIPTRSPAFAIEKRKLPRLLARVLCQQRLASNDRRFGEHSLPVDHSGIHLHDRPSREITSRHQVTTGRVHRSIGFEKRD